MAACRDSALFCFVRELFVLCFVRDERGIENNIGRWGRVR